jgi:hypothetical protein
MRRTILARLVSIVIFPGEHDDRVGAHRQLTEIVSSDEDVRSRAGASFARPATACCHFLVKHLRRLLNACAGASTGPHPMKREFFALCIALLVMSHPRSATAQDIVVARKQAAEIACAQDLARFCRDVRPGGGRIIDCMNLHADKLDQRCFQAMTAWLLARANAFKACLPDAERLCPHLPPRGPRGRACLLRNADKLSKQCLDALRGED